jgi:hypothetical protein
MKKLLVFIGHVRFNSINSINKALPLHMGRLFALHRKRIGADSLSPKPKKFVAASYCHHDFIIGTTSMPPYSNKGALVTIVEVTCQISPANLGHKKFTPLSNSAPWNVRGAWL